jgi:membrane-associated phospholipid phosphatase
MKEWTMTNRRGAVALGCCLALTLAGPARAEDPRRVKWSEDWPRVRLAEVVNIVGLTVASAAIAAYWQPPTSASWHQAILFDDWARDLLRGQTYKTQATAADLSDWLYKGAVFAPYLIDVYFVTLGVHENADVGVQMLLINLQSLGITGVLSLAAERAVGRSRPYVRDCGPDGKVRSPSGEILYNSCGTEGDFQSFYSGHAAATATSAGLTCVHHQHLPLYGGGIADLTPCVLMIGVSAVTGVSRMVADRHWASDVIVGWSVGAFSGYVIPSLLHYGFGSGRPVGELSLGPAHAVPIIGVQPRGASIGLAGVLP